MPSKSFLDLKAQLSKQEAEFAKSRAENSSTVRGGVARTNKKPTIWARQNKGVADRSARDAAWALASKPTSESVLKSLERKAALYDKLKKGMTGGLSEKQYDALLVDFDNKEDSDGDLTNDADSDDALSDKDDPVVEYEDEFGRLRTAKRSEVPRHLRPENNEQTTGDTYDDAFVIRGDANYFPVYEPSDERIAAVNAELAEDANPATHYDATAEVRARGAGFYQFSKDEETRQQQLEELQRTRTQTEQARNDAGADAPGKRAGMEKRKRDLEERRKAVEAKRKKTSSATDPPRASFVPPQETSETPATNAVPDHPRSALSPADEFLASLERDLAPRPS